MLSKITHAAAISLSIFSFSLAHAQDDKVATSTALNQADIQKVADTFHAWQQGVGYEDVKGFCFSASLDDVRKHEHVLTPGRYVGAEAQADDGEAFADKMARLTAQLAEKFAESAKLQGEIKQNLAGIGYDI